MFRFEIDDIVYYVGDNKIFMGQVIGRKIVEAPSFNKPMHEFADKSTSFNIPGNRLGVPGIKYEVRWIDQYAPDHNTNRSDVFNEHQLFKSPREVAGFFSGLADGMELIDGDVE